MQCCWHSPAPRGRALKKLAGRHSRGTVRWPHGRLLQDRESGPLGMPRQPVGRDPGHYLVRVRAPAPTLAAMCGRFASLLPPEAIARLFRTVGTVPNHAASWNVAPRQDAFVVRRHPETGERHLMWDLRHLAGEAVYLSGGRLRKPVDRFRSHCDGPSAYLTNNETALIDYSLRYHASMPASTSRAEGCFDEIANLRMAKRRCMRWSHRGAHRVTLLRVAVLDGRLSGNSPSKQEA